MVEMNGDIHFVSIEGNSLKCHRARRQNGPYDERWTPHCGRCLAGSHRPVAGGKLLRFCWGSAASPRVTFAKSLTPQNLDVLFCKVDKGHPPAGVALRSSSKTFHPPRALPVNWDDPQKRPRTMSDMPWGAASVAANTIFISTNKP